MSVRPIQPPMRRARSGGGLLALIKPHTFWNIGDPPPLTCLGKTLARFGIFKPQ